MKDLSFGEAINLVKEGQLVTRKGWNGKGMFVFMRPADSLPMDFLDKVKSLPQKVKDYFLSNPTEKLTHVEFTSYLCMKSADNKIVNGWLASQTDMLATDWQLFEA